MDEKSIDVGANILSDKNHYRTENLHKIKSLNAEIVQHKEMALAAFAKVQLSMSNTFASKDWPVDRLRERVRQLDKHLEEIEVKSAQVLVAMSPVHHDTGLGTGVTPAELEGARVRSEQAAADSE